MPISGEQRTVARFERVTLVLSGGGALAAYQGGAYAAMDAAGFEPDAIAAAGMGAINAALIAGNPPRQRVARLRTFWHRLGEACLAAEAPGIGDLLRRVLRRERRPVFDARRVRALLVELVDFGRINGGVTRLALAARHVATGSDVSFDNDRHVLGPEHVLACATTAATPVTIEHEAYGRATPAAEAPLHLLFERVAPADTLCFVLDCFDPEPGRVRGSSRAREEIAAIRRRHDLHRALGLVGERLPPDLCADPEIAACLAQGSMATMNLVHLVHECSPAELAAKLADYTPARVVQRWRAGERDMAASLARPAWLAPPPRRRGVVVHELRGGGVPLRS